MKAMTFSDVSKELDELFSSTRYDVEFKPGELPTIDEDDDDDE